VDVPALWGVVIAALIAAAGALVGYGVLRQQVAALETWRVRQEILTSMQDDKIQKIMVIAERTTVNVANLTENMDRLLQMHLKSGRS
jgi:hypothetical protein